MILRRRQVLKPAIVNHCSRQILKPARTILCSGAGRKQESGVRNRKTDSAGNRTE